MDNTDILTIKELALYLKLAEKLTNWLLMASCQGLKWAVHGDFGGLKLTVG